MKFEKIYDYSGDLAGYKYGDHYLMKFHHFGGGFSWGINNEPKSVYDAYERLEKVDNGEIEFVHSYKQGRARLIEIEGQ